MVRGGVARPRGAIGAGAGSHRPEGAGAPDVRITLLGGFGVAVGDREIPAPAWRLRKAAGLVKLLALAPGHRLRREQVLDALWPELTPEAAANNLRVTLHAARRALDPALAATATALPLVRDRLTLAPAGALWIDVQAFEAAAAAAQRAGDPAACRAALALYTGDLLPEDRYEEWIRERREALQRTVLGLCLTLARLHEARGEHHQAIAALSRAVEQDPTLEEAHTGLMRLYALTNSPQRAVRQYRHLQEVLARELEVEPDPDSQRLYGAILARRFPGGGPAAAPAAPAAVRHNLPVPMTSFIGRRREVAEIEALLGRANRGSRLLTLIGPGGGGKTRLALEVARELLRIADRQSGSEEHEPADPPPEAGLAGRASPFPDGVWLVELAALADPALVTAAVARVLGVTETAGRRLAETLAEVLRPKRLLLLLDNCEHLADACAALAHTLLAAAPAIQILATSREALRVPGELLYRVPPLSLPAAAGAAAARDGSGEDAVAAAAASEAVQLLVDRIRWGEPAFTLTPDRADAVQQICRRLDGIPLAIELAAARAPVLGVAGVAARLGDALSLLRGGARGAEPRQQTLRAALDWSYALLPPAERTLLDRLAAFAGGWTLAAAEAVCGRPAPDRRSPAPDGVLDLLARLLDKSLIQVAETDGEVRYRLLEIVRQYAAERLDAGGEADGVRRRHAEHYLELAEAAAPELRGPRQVAWLDRLQAEHDNLRQAIDWSVAAGQAELALRLTGALWRFWYLRGHPGEGRRWLAAALGCNQEGLDGPRAQALLGAGALAHNQADFAAARPPLEEAVRLYRALRDSRGMYAALGSLAMVPLSQGDHGAARALLEEALALARRLGGTRGIAECLSNLGIAALEQGDLLAAREYLEEALALKRQLGDRHAIAGGLGLLATLALSQGDHGAARSLLQESLAMAREVGNRQEVADQLRALGVAAQAQGDDAAARACFVESLTLKRDLGNRLGIAECLERLAALAGSRADPSRAARLFGAAEALRATIGAPLPPSASGAHEREVALVRAALDPPLFAEATAAGRALSLDAAVAEALAVPAD
jgi:predicted ATPase/DNA-binding SARP family transcriptional activator